MRYVEHCLSQRFLSWCMLAFLLIVLALLCADRFRHSSLLVQMGRVFAESIPLSTYGWFLACGIIFPFAYYVFLYTCTSLGGKFSMSSNIDNYRVYDYHFPATPYLFTFLLMIAVSKLLAQLITKNPSARFVPSRPSSFYPIIGVLLLLFGSHLSNVSFTVALYLTTPVLLWFAWSIIRSIFSKDPINILIRQVRVRMLMISTCAAMILFMLASIGFAIGERYWVRQDRLTDLPKNRLATSSYEEKVTEILYQEILTLRDSD